MTYIDYLNDFNQWLETNNLSVSSQLMFYKLLYVFNRAGWPEDVGVDNLRLRQMLGNAAETTVVRARDALVEAGFITYQKGRKGRPNRYSLCGKHYISASENASVSASENASHIKTKTKTKKIPPNGGMAANAAAPASENWGFGPELTAALNDWLTYKQEKRDGYQPTGKKALVTQVKNNAEKYGETAVAALIRQCMSANWKGIIWDKLGEQGDRGAQRAKGRTATAPGTDFQPSPERIRKNEDWLDRFLAEQEAKGGGAGSPGGWS